MLSLRRQVWQYKGLAANGKREGGEKHPHFPSHDSSRCRSPTVIVGMALVTFLAVKENRFFMHG
jgi:hypothetical protein